MGLIVMIQLIHSDDDDDQLQVDKKPGLMIHLIHPHQRWRPRCCWCGVVLTISHPPTSATLVMMMMMTLMVMMLMVNTVNGDEILGF